MSNYQPPGVSCYHMYRFSGQIFIENELLLVQTGRDQISIYDQIFLSTGMVQFSKIINKMKLHKRATFIRTKWNTLILTNNVVLSLAKAVLPL